MAVPNNYDFSFHDVCMEIYGDTNPGRNLSQAFLDAKPHGFDPNYEGSHDRLTNFRNYKHWPSFSDWFLPSRDELIAMYDNLYDIPEPLMDFNGGSTYVWSSSEYQAMSAWIKVFGNGHNGTLGKSQSSGVWPLRRMLYSYIDTIPYSIGDRGPSGGYISDIYESLPDIWVYEAAPYPIAPRSWSNITDVMVGTNTAKWQGYNNTNYIVDQEDHTHSAAQNCLNHIS